MNPGHIPARTRVTTRSQHQQIQPPPEAPEPAPPSATSPRKRRKRVQPEVEAVEAAVPTLTAWEAMPPELVVHVVHCMDFSSLALFRCASKLNIAAVADLWPHRAAVVQEELRRFTDWAKYFNEFSLYYVMKLVEKLCTAEIKKALRDAELAAGNANAMDVGDKWWREMYRGQQSSINSLRKLVQEQGVVRRGRIQERPLFAPKSVVEQPEGQTQMVPVANTSLIERLRAYKSTRKGLSKVKDWGKVKYKYLTKRNSELQDLVGKDEDSQWKQKPVLPGSTAIKTFDDFFGWLEGLVYAVGVIGSFDWQVAGVVHCEAHLIAALRILLSNRDPFGCYSSPTSPTRPSSAPNSPPWLGTPTSTVISTAASFTTPLSSISIVPPQVLSMAIPTFSLATAAKLPASKTAPLPPPPTNLLSIPSPTTSPTKLGGTNSSFQSDDGGDSSFGDGTTTVSQPPSPIPTGLVKEFPKFRSKLAVYTRLYKYSPYTPPDERFETYTVAAMPATYSDSSAAPYADFSSVNTSFNASIDQTLDEDDFR